MIESLEPAEDSYTPETLGRHGKAMDELYGDILFIDDTGADPESSQFYLLALASLEMARRYMALARGKQIDAIKKE